ncbi:MerR family transcriptional regulator [Sporosarcina trichiuri]|uniref:MerR family transcriptional regulator n=1 Tax=Sporosarcina trichiuri TaxID=3056445 RepID=UPI0025B5F706|nr:MerR family transcriptional regulator [Sporosarcina sp. 0.2-SM1T-5]WJY27275.1 MerR family transcriptional regulator [Sporosarcina sp. 0.2-SM1T-5]
MHIKQAAELAGVSVRTLHHYDEIGLLSPDRVTDAGYRIYSDDNLRRLQSILYYRELGFPLKEIGDIVGDPAFDRLAVLEDQRNQLLAKQRQLALMLETIDQSIQEERGEHMMTHEERFKGFDFSQNPYEDEAKERWGSETVEKTNAALQGFGKEAEDRMNEIFRSLAAIRQQAPDSEEAQAVIGDWYRFLNTIGTYTPQAFAGLGEMYTADERFTQSIDRFGTGLAAFMQQAMAVYAERLQDGSA